MRGTSGEAGQTLILATDRSLSVLAEIASAGVNRVAYTPYGNSNAARPSQSRLGFNGELREGPGWYHLGNGHRVYNPALRRFHSPDRLSPFDKGGLNPYTYCLGDPVNHTDPTGRIAKFLHIAAFIGFGIALFSGAVGLLAPLLVKSAVTPNVAAALVNASSVFANIGTGKKAGLLATYAAKQPGMVGTPLGGLDALSSMVSLAGVPVGVPTTMLSMNGQSGEMVADLMMTSAILGLSVLPVKGILVPLTPKLLTSTWGARFSKLVHGRAKVASAWQDYRDVLKLEELKAVVESSKRIAPASPTLSVAPSLYLSASSTGSVSSSASFKSTRSATSVTRDLMDAIRRLGENL